MQLPAMLQPLTKYPRALLAALTGAVMGLALTGASQAATGPQLLAQFNATTLQIEVYARGTNGTVLLTPTGPCQRIRTGQICGYAASDANGAITAQLLTQFGGGTVQARWIRVGSITPLTNSLDVQWVAGAFQRAKAITPRGVWPSQSVDLYRAGLTPPLKLIANPGGAISVEG